MLDPAFYPSRPQRVELRETHASWVFLSGELAYKVKKPVVLPFLDYGTPERRLRMCREEVRLNRRLAPGYYLGVDGILRQAGRYSLGPEEHPAAVDYAVRMRRVPEELSLARLIERDQLQPPELDAVGRRLAAFHLAADQAPPEGRDLSHLERSLRENVATLESIGPPALSPLRIQAMRHFTEAYLTACREQLQSRVAEGWTRDCHGDLRAEHVIVANGIDVYDCVEFDPALRYIDVACDFAFLVMDVARLGCVELADRLVASYRKAGGDPGDDALLSFYAAYRAWVRSKVACVRAAELRQGDPERALLESEAVTLLDLGHRFAWRARLPLVVAICGVAASGKTALARRVEAASGLRHLSSDVTRKRLAGLAPTERASAEHYGEDFDRRTYEELGRLAAQEADRSGGAIVDATFRSLGSRRAFAAGLGDAPAPVFFAKCAAPPEVLVARAAAREGQAHVVSDAGPAVVKRQLRELEPLDEVPGRLRAELRTDRPVEEALVELEVCLDGLLGSLR
jgi:aminoglycoside phosphotransferase family enzyme/predicted kinase